MGYEFEGRLKKILPIITSGTFRKIEFILVTDEQYPQMIKFELQNDKIQLIEPFFIGDQIKLNFNIRGREWTNPEGKVIYFTSFQAWRIMKVQNGYIVPTKESPDQIPKYNLNFPPAESIFGNPKENPNSEQIKQFEKWKREEEDDLPF